MKIAPTYRIVTEILELIVKIDSNRLFFKDKKISEEIKNNIQRISLLKTSVFSARIEGNPLTLEDVETSKDKQKRIEIFNILETAENIIRTVKPNQQINIRIIKDTHSLVMKNLSPDNGRFRKEMSAIFNQAGIAIYTTRPPEKIPTLLTQLLQYANSKDERFPLITARSEEY